MSLAVIIGPSGIGKSTLADELLQQWRFSGQTDQVVYVSNQRNESYGLRRKRVGALLRQPGLWMIPIFSIRKARLARRNLKSLFSLTAIWARGLQLCDGNPRRWVVIDQGLFVVPNPLSKSSSKFLLTPPELILVPAHRSIDPKKCRECDCESSRCVLRYLRIEREFRPHWRSSLDEDLLREWGATGTVLEALIGREIWVVGKGSREASSELKTEVL